MLSIILITRATPLKLELVNTSSLELGFGPLQCINFTLENDDKNYHNHHLCTGSASPEYNYSRVHVGTLGRSIVCSYTNVHSMQIVKEVEA